MPRKVIHIFRRDLRMDDNTASHEAAGDGNTVLPIFIFDPRQTQHHPYRSLPAQQFLFATLRELDQSLVSVGSRLGKFFGEAQSVLEKILAWAKENGTPFSAVYCNRDYTPFSRNRDRALAELCKKMEVEFHLHADALLHEPEEVLKDDGTPYTIYTPFSKRAMKVAVRKVRSIFKVANTVPPLPFEENCEIYDRLLPERRTGLLLEGGRKEAERILAGISRYKNYDEERNFPALLGTTGLSTHNKFGTISVRELYHAVRDTLGEGHTLIREILWRDFFHHIAFHFPHVFKGPFNRAYGKLIWRESDGDFQKWCRGETGFPIVDAGMRQLNRTGFMHNRVRMIVASFLTKDLQIDWRAGERYFARTLLDYDPCVNNGNWQWAASTGCDAQPYFRIFNPWLQQEKFDPDGRYIKLWVPELQGLTTKELHGLGDKKAGRPVAYPPPMVDHAEAKEATITMFAEARDATTLEQKS